MRPRAERSTAADFHFGSRPHKRNYCFVLTSLVLGGLHQRSGVALPTGGRADPAVGNEALAGTRRSVFFSLVPGARWYPTLKPRQFFHTKTKISRTRVHTGRRTDFFWGVYQLETRFARIMEDERMTDDIRHTLCHTSGQTKVQRLPNKVDLRAEWPLQGIQSEKVAS